MRRTLLQAIALPLLLSWEAGCTSRAARAAGGPPRELSPAEAAAVASVLASTVPKAKVSFF